MTAVEFSQLLQNIDTSDFFGCDCSPANIFLYQEQQQSSVFVHNQVLYRFFGNIQKGKHAKGAFPIPFKNSTDDFILNSIDYLLKNYSILEFCLCTESQTKLIDNILNLHFPEYHIEWESDRSQSDYLYLQQNLAQLQGQKYQKKKNHVLHFIKTYENNWNFLYFDKSNIDENIKKQIILIEEKWFQERNGSSFSELIAERNIIHNAVENFEVLNMSGGLLYINNEPVAMTLASPISASVLDINFEKSLAEPAKNGAYAAINQFFAQNCNSYEYLNREEDLGIPGLRKAKLSYKPDIILDKFSGILQKK